jgi:hypothetical protein
MESFWSNSESVRTKFYSGDKRRLMSQLEQPGRQRPGLRLILV